MQRQTAADLGQLHQIHFAVIEIGQTVAVPIFKLCDRRVVNVRQRAAVAIRDVQIAVSRQGGKSRPVIHLGNAEGKAVFVDDLGQKIDVVQIGAVDLQSVQLGQFHDRGDVRKIEDSV